MKDDIQRTCEIFDIVECSIREVIMNFIRRPYDYFFESDLQAALHGEMKQQIDLHKYLSSYFKVDTIMDKNKIAATSLLHTELRYDRYHIDIGIWNRNDKENLFGNVDPWSKPLLAGIELKYHWNTYLSLKKNKQPQQHHLIQSYITDLDKLRKLSVNATSKGNVFRGYALWFLPNIENETKIFKNHSIASSELYKCFAGYLNEDLKSYIIFRGHHSINGIVQR